MVDTTPWERDRSRASPLILALLPNFKYLAHFGTGQQQYDNVPITSPFLPGTDTVADRSAQSVLSTRLGYLNGHQSDAGASIMVRSSLGIVLVVGRNVYLIRRLARRPSGRHSNRSPAWGRPSRRSQWVQKCARPLGAPHNHTGEHGNEASHGGSGASSRPSRLSVGI